MQLSRSQAFCAIAVEYFAFQSSVPDQTASLAPRVLQASISMPGTIPAGQRRSKDSKSRRSQWSGRRIDWLAGAAGPKPVRRLQREGRGCQRRERAAARAVQEPFDRRARALGRRRLQNGYALKDSSRTGIDEQGARENGLAVRGELPTNPVCGPVPPRGRPAS